MRGMAAGWMCGFVQMTLQQEFMHVKVIYEK
jgi:hypothetical protein